MEQFVRAVVLLCCGASSVYNTDEDGHSNGVTSASRQREPLCLGAGRRNALRVLWHRGTRRGRAQPSSQCQPRAAVDRQAHASTRTHCSEGKGEGMAPSPRGELPRATTRPRTHHPAAWRSAGLQSVFACRLSFARAPWASGWRAGDAALSAQRRVPDGVRPRVTREVRSRCVAAASLAECLVLWFCVSLLDRYSRPEAGVLST